MVFAGPPEDDIDWADVSPGSSRKFLARAWRLAGDVTSAPGVDPRTGDEAVRTATHRLADAAAQAIESYRFNVAVAKVMELVNAARKAIDSGPGCGPGRARSGRERRDPASIVAPYTAEDMWARLGHAPSVARAGWPEVDPELLVHEEVTCVVQVAGKVKARLQVSPEIGEQELQAAALADPAVVAALGGATPARVIVRPPGWSTSSLDADLAGRAPPAPLGYADATGRRRHRLHRLPARRTRRQVGCARGARAGHRGGQGYEEGTQIQPWQVAEALREWKVITTSRPTPADFGSMYAAAAAAGADAIVSIHLSADMSGTYESALMASADAPVPVTVIDSRSVGMGLGFAVLAAAQAAAAEEDAESVEEARRVAAGAQLLFYVDTLEYLRGVANRRDLGGGGDGIAGEAAAGTCGRQSGAAGEGAHREQGLGSAGGHHRGTGRWSPDGRCRAAPMAPDRAAALAADLAVGWRCRRFPVNEVGAVVGATWVPAWWR